MSIDFKIVDVYYYCIRGEGTINAFTFHEYIQFRKLSSFETDLCRVVAFIYIRTTHAPLTWSMSLKHSNRHLADPSDQRLQFIY